MSTYDVILVNPVSHIFDQRKLPNVGLAAIDAYLNHNGYTSKVIDLSEIQDYLDKSDVFGVSVWDHTYKPAQKLMRCLQDKTVIWGGWAVMSRPEFILQENPGVTYAVLQDGEQRLRKLLDSLKTPDVFDTIDGIAFRDHNGAIITRPAQEFFNLDELPVPTAETKELPRRVDASGIVYLELARGCYGRCAYCQHIIKMRFRDAKKVAQEMQFWYERGHTQFFIGNDNSLAKTPLIEELIQEIEQRELHVSIMVSGRPNDVLKGLHVVERVFKSDIVNFFAIEMGIESNSQRMLDLLQRGLNPETNRKAMDALCDLKAKYSPETSILANIILFPHWDMAIDDFVENVQFMGDYQSSRETMSLRLYGVAGTPLWEEMTANGFEMNKGFGQRITDYPFNNDDVECLYHKLVRAPLEEIQQGVSRNPLRYFAMQKEIATFQSQVHDRIMDFYRANDSKQAVMDFLNA